MSFEHVGDLARDILEIFFEAQRNGCQDVDEEMVISSRAEHRRRYQQEWASNARQDGYCQHPPQTKFVKCARDGCPRMVAVKTGIRGRRRKYHSSACRLLSWRKTRHET